MNLKFPQLLEQGGKGMPDGLSRTYLHENLGFEIIPPPNDSPPPEQVPPWMQKIWWWRTNENECPVNLTSFSCQNHSLQFADGGKEIAFRYERLARALGRYPFNLPYTQLSLSQLEEFSAWSRMPSANIGIVPSIKIWDVSTKPGERVYPDHFFDPAIENPRVNESKGELWSQSKVVVFNLKKSTSTILTEIEKFIERERVRTECPEPHGDRTATSILSLKFRT